MFLENCKDCGKKVSIRAKACPKCGVEAPTKNFSNKHPKCLIQDCNEYAVKGFDGMCIDDYKKEKKEKTENTNKIIIVFLLFF